MLKITLLSRCCSISVSRPSKPAAFPAFNRLRPWEGRGGEGRGGEGRGGEGRGGVGRGGSEGKGGRGGRGGRERTMNVLCH